MKKNFDDFIKDYPDLTDTELLAVNQWFFYNEVKCFEDIVASGSYSGSMAKIISGRLSGAIKRPSNRPINNLSKDLDAAIEVSSIFYLDYLSGVGKKITYDEALAEAKGRLLISEARAKQHYEKSKDLIELIFHVMSNVKKYVDELENAKALLEAEQEKPCKSCEVLVNNVPFRLPDDRGQLLVFLTLKGVKDLINHESNGEALLSRCPNDMIHHVIGRLFHRYFANCQKI